MNLRNALRAETRSTDEDGNTTFSLQEYIEQVRLTRLGVNGFGLTEPTQTLGSKEEEPALNFESYVQGIYKRNGIVFAVMSARMLLFSEARFQYQRMVNGRPGELFGTTDLVALEKPWNGGTTGSLLSRMIQDADLDGNFYGVRRPGNKIRRLRPDWVTIVLGSESDDSVGFGDADCDVLGYMYRPGGPGSGRKPTFYLQSEVVHFAPNPDPQATFRGMSWLTPIIRDVMGDNAATNHKLKFFENGATPNMVVTMSDTIKRDEYEKWLALMEEKGGGEANAYKTLYLGGGATAQPIGVDLKSADFSAIQGAGESRIASAGGMPPVIVGFAEGLKAATYSNYQMARKRLGDGTLRPLWREAAGALESIIEVPYGARLWYDDRDIPFLREDRKDNAEVQQKDALTIEAYIKAGFDPETVVEAVNADDLTRLKHTGLVSVQLQEPGDTLPPEPSAAPTEDEESEALEDAE